MSSLKDFVAEVKAKAERDAGEARAWLEEKLPGVADLAERAEGNPVIDAVLASVHISPAIFSALAAAITQMEADLAAAAPPPAEPVADDQGPDPAP